MAHLPPSAVFGTLNKVQAVHVLLLIENSLPMAEHREDLQHQILPGLLGAIRVANPGGNVQIFWETTGKTQEQRATQKGQRHFNDFPDINIVGLPQNKLSPLFVRQSVDLFLLNNVPSSKPHAMRHLVIVAMSNPFDDSPGTSDNGTADGADAKVTWESVAEKLQKNNIIVHVVANPAARMTRIFDLFRKTLRTQSRQEVIPWQSPDTSRCICHLSGSTMMTRDNSRSAPQDEWPEISPTSNDPYDLSVAPTYPPQYAHSVIPTYSTPSVYPADPLSSVHLYDQQAVQQTANNAVALVDPGTNEPLTVGGPVSLVSRMQALHGLAKRRPERERARAAHTSFFREPEPPRPSGSPGGGVERTERVRPHHNLASSPLGVRPSLSPNASSDGRLPGQDGTRVTSGKGPSSPERRSGRHSRTSSRSATTATMSPAALYSLPPSSPSSEGSPGSTPSPMWPSPGLSGNSAASTTQGNLSYPRPPAGYSSSVTVNAVPLTELGRRYAPAVSSVGPEYGLGMSTNIAVPNQPQVNDRYSHINGPHPVATHPSFSMPNTPLTTANHMGNNTSVSVPTTPYAASSGLGGRVATYDDPVPMYHQLMSLSTPTTYHAPASAPAMASNSLNYFSLPFDSTTSISEPPPTASMPHPPAAARTAMNLHLPASIPSTLPVSESGELEVVPASAPLDPAGEVPFIIDEAAEKRAEIKLERALQAMREEAEVQNAVSAASLNVSGNTNINVYPTVKPTMSDAGPLSPTRTSSSFSLPNSPIAHIPPTYDTGPQGYVGLSYTSASSSAVQK